MKRLVALALLLPALALAQDAAPQLQEDPRAARFKDVERGFFIGFEAGYIGLLDTPVADPEKAAAPLTGVKREVQRNPADAAQPTLAPKRALAEAPAAQDVTAPRMFERKPAPAAEIASIERTRSSSNSAGVISKIRRWKCPCLPPPVETGRGKRSNPAPLPPSRAAGPAGRVDGR